ncbi:GyrI-like domain-containing protein [Halobacteriovorax sp.]|uniref:GyrI-like domain-containing protein n=1 Tax=Halobacteriovorax sp. TaxID=2020862 RepID=UPI003564110B
MEVVNVQGFKVRGFSVRTKNELESDPSTGKIPTLWKKFFDELTPKFDTKSNIYGVYTNYESDDSGEFDIFATTDGLNNCEGTETLDVESGKYLVFVQDGEMPNAVIEAWVEIWEYFKSDECLFTREYKTDFEKYIGPSRVEVYIGIK